MKLLIMSDSHGEQRYMEEAVYREMPDHIVHLGDVMRDAQLLHECFPAIPMTSMPGNRDFNTVDPPVIVTVFGGVKFLLTHGHTLGVKFSALKLLLAAQEAGVRVALFGHTHQAVNFEQQGVLLMNPGAAGGFQPSYGVIEIENGEISSRIERF